MNQKSLDKKKTKDWDKELEKLSEQYDDYFTAVSLDDVKKLISKLLTQQRTELLEEIKGLIKESFDNNGFLDTVEKSINTSITNLLNKKL